MSELRAAYLNGKAIAASTFDARWAAYGDGLFETMRAISGAIPLLTLHLARLRLGCDRLRLMPPDFDWLQGEISMLAALHKDASIKLIAATRGAARGYARSEKNACDFALLVSSPPSIPPALWENGLSLGVAQIRLAAQPALSGIKHLNRLEQVLARAEHSSTEADEVLMQNYADHVVCASAANVLVLLDGQWLTPPITDCGVAGVMRAHLLQAFACFEQRTLSIADLMRADLVALSNALRGVRPVGRLRHAGQEQFYSQRHFAKLHAFNKVFAELG